jgi:hypothetical protein
MMSTPAPVTTTPGSEPGAPASGAPPAGAAAMPTEPPAAAPAAMDAGVTGDGSSRDEDAGALDQN